MKLGIVTPFSNDFPFLAREFKRGLMLTFSKVDHVLTAFIDVDKGEPKDILPAFRRLIIDEEVDLIIAFLDSIVAKSINELVTATQTPCILSGMGARLPLSGKDSSPFIFHNTLQVWESCWLSGALFSERLGRHYSVMTSFFTSGFPLTYAHVTGAATKGSGEPQGILITHKESIDQEWPHVMDLLREREVDYVFLAYYGKERREVLQKLSEAAFPVEKIITSPGVFDGTDNIRSIASWYLTLDNEANSQFIERYVLETGKPPSVFSMLGYETALLVSSCFARDGGFRSDQFCRQLLDVSIQGPRGEVAFITENQYTSCSHYLHESGQLIALAYPIDSIRTEIEKNAVANHVGWHNTYLCR